MSDRRRFHGDRFATVLSRFTVAVREGTHVHQIPAHALQMNLVKNAGRSVLRLEWLSYPDYLDVLQSQNQLQSGAWTEVEKFSGTGAITTKAFPAGESAAFYRLQRALK